MEEIKLDDINIFDFGNEIQIAGTIWAGKGQAFITTVPGKDDDLSNLKLMPLSLDEWEKLLKQTDLLETEIFQRDPTGKLVKIIYRKTQRQIDSFVQWAVFARDNYSCRYCGRTGIPLTVDHIDLWELGGASIVENLVSACRPCNKDRGRMFYGTWMVSPIYKKKSKNLTPEQLQANENIILSLPDLINKRVVNTRSR